MDDRDIFAIIALIGGFLIVAVDARTLAALNFKNEDAKPTHLWGELRSKNAKFTFIGWIVSGMMATISIGSSLILIYYYVEPYSWWLLNAATITLMVGAFSWYDLTHVVYCNDVRDLAAIPVLLTAFGNGLMLVMLVHPETKPLTSDEADLIALRMVYVMLGIGFTHHVVMDVFIWYLSFVYMDTNEKTACAAPFEVVTVGTEAEEVGLKSDNLKTLIGSQRRRHIPGHAC